MFGVSVLLFGFGCWAIAAMVGLIVGLVCIVACCVGYLSGFT